MSDQAAIRAALVGPLPQRSVVRTRACCLQSCTETLFPRHRRRKPLRRVANAGRRADAVPRPTRAPRSVDQRKTRSVAHRIFGVSLVRYFEIWNMESEI